MKVCHILASDGYGGLEKHVLELSHALQGEGIDITIIAPKRYQEDFSKLRFIPLNLKRSRKNPILLLQLYRILKRENFDVVHAQANKATDMLATLKPFLSCKIIATLHNYKKHIKSFLKVDHVITVSDRIGEKLVTKNKTTIYNGIQVGSVKKKDLRLEYGLPSESFVLCAVGRFVKAKGFDMLIESMQYVDKNVYLFLIGDGIYMNDLKEKVKKYHLDEKIIFLGNLSNQQTKEMVKSSDVVVIPSRREGFSYVFAESLLLHIPLVSTDVADIKKFITDKFIVPFDTHRLAEKICYIADNYNEVLKAYQTVFVTAEEEFSLEKMVQSTIGVYYKVLSNNR